MSPAAAHRVLCMSAESMHAKTSLPLFPRVQAVLGCHTCENSSNSGITELRTACRSIKCRAGQDGCFHWGLISHVTSSTY